MHKTTDLNKTRIRVLLLTEQVIHPLQAEQSNLLWIKNYSERGVPGVNRSPFWYSFCNPSVDYLVQCALWLRNPLETENCSFFGHPKAQRMSFSESNKIFQFCKMLKIANSIYNILD